MWTVSNLQRQSNLDRPAPPPAALRTILARRELKRGDTLYRSGDTGPAVYRVEAGLLKLFLDVAGGKERILSLAGPGDLIGSIAPSQTQYTESAEALSGSVQVGVLDYSAVGHAFELLHDAGAKQLQQLRDALEDADLPVPARLARTFVRLGDRFGNVQEDGLTRVTLPLTHDNLAAMIGAARETTSTTLAQMRESGVLSGTRGNYSYHLHELLSFAAEVVANSSA